MTKFNLNSWVPAGAGNDDDDDDAKLSSPITTI